MVAQDMTREVTYCLAWLPAGRGSQQPEPDASQSAFIPRHGTLDPVMVAQDMTREVTHCLACLPAGRGSQQPDPDASQSPFTPRHPL